MANDAVRAARLAATRGEALVPWTFEALLREVVDDQTYPVLHRIAWADGGEKASGPDERAEFRFGLERILDGVQVLINQSVSSNRL